MQIKDLHQTKLQQNLFHKNYFYTEFPDKFVLQKITDNQSFKTKQIN